MSVSYTHLEKLPEEVWQVLADLDRENAQKMSKQDKILSLIHINCAPLVKRQNYED